jgi:hypothetical protein
MKTSLIAVLIFASVGAGAQAAASQGTVHEGREAARAAKAERKAWLGTLQKGKTIRGDTATYQHLPEVRALERQSAGETPQQTVDRLGFAGLKVVEAKNRMVLYQLPSSAAGPAQVLASGQVMHYPTVLNLRTQVVGVLNGIQVVQPRNMADADAIAASHGLEVVRSFPHLRTVFYRPRVAGDIADLAAALQVDPRVERAYPEVIEHDRVPW